MPELSNKIVHNNHLFAEHALTPSGWRENVLIRWDTTGTITSVEENSTPATDAVKVEHLMPGMVNLHSHAFQRGFAGLSEYRYKADDSFWSWRQLMYQFANAIDPAQLELIATFLYREMLAAGYTSVCEFHYLHHQPGGSSYSDPCAMSRSLIKAADNAGIGLTLLPVFYCYSGFGKKTAEPHQLRFVHSAEAMYDLWKGLYDTSQGSCHRVGIAPHSLRAVDIDILKMLLADIHQIDPEVPIHIHIAEQRQEVADCLTAHGKTPVALLMEQSIIDDHWCLVHATHMTPEEYLQIADKGAVAGLCPTTEANLGDGIFDLNRFRDINGNWGIGSDSNTVVNPAEELMILEYSQRLKNEKRNIYVTQKRAEVAESLYLDALRGGAQVSGRPVAGIMPGQSADFVELNSSHPSLAGLPHEKIASGHIFASSRSTALKRIWTRGIVRITDCNQYTIPEANEFCRLRKQLLEFCEGQNK